jgi:hypothetical protein
MVEKKCDFGNYATIIKNNTDISASLSLKSSKTITNKIHLKEDKNIILREQEQVYNLNNDSQTTFIKRSFSTDSLIFWTKRGYFFESYSEGVVAKNGLSYAFLSDSQSFLKKA